MWLALRCRSTLRDSVAADVNWKLPRPHSSIEYAIQPPKTGVRRVRRRSSA